MIVWDNDLRQWIDDATGLAAPVAAVMAARDAMADDYAAAFRQLAVLYTGGQLTLDQWRRSFEALVVEAVGHGYTFGRGGIELMTESDWAKVAESVRDQLDFADGFAGDIERTVNERMAAIMEESEEAIEQAEAERQARAEAESAMTARSEMYAGASVEAYEEAQAEAHSSGKGVLILPVYPADHGTECRSNCRCGWQIIGDEEAQVWRCTWITAGDQAVCDGCRERGRLYANLIVPYDGSPARVE